MKIYLVRHGQTDWNVERRKQGRTDVPLNATGVWQAEEARDKLAGYEFDICYASPLKRAAKTAEIVVDGRCEIVLDARLVERGFGEFEGQISHSKDDWSDLTGGVDITDRRQNTGIRGLEPVKSVLERSRSFLDDVLSRHDDDARVLVVAHGWLLKALHFNIVGYDDDTDFWEFHLQNGEVAEYEVRRG